ncbi:ABC-type transport system, involved in lipoprotein release, permease component [Olivibacter domesticus]|uniref:ABC-type transport system, involved in lipoprotein release, permease component n=1 Tax=Olivibacter domesticus TaxID=407022 RepID=A0A1H7R8Q9_OLID1|nr:ABC-type transport system, involved in lipoprotein release, permease component [Olivibacter domesticus]
MFGTEIEVEKNLNAYIFHITPYDLIFLGVIFIGLSFALQLGFAKRINRAANRFLSLALVTMVLCLLWVLGKNIGLASYFSHWSWLPLQFSLALGPLIFFYVRKITQPNSPFRFKDLLHFGPLLLEQGVLVLEIRESIRTGGATYHTLTFHQLNPILQLLAFISVCTYLYISHRLVECFYRGLKFNRGDRHRYALRWLHHLLLGFSLLWLLWIPLTAVDYFYYHYQLGIQAYYFLYLLLVAMAIWMAVIALLKPETGVQTDAPSFLKAPLPAELKHKGLWLKKVIKTNCYYKDPELSLSSLAEKLELTTHELSRIINTVLKKSFNDFINQYRVADVVQKMQDPAYDHLTLLGIAYESGFNSKTTFNRTFKQMTGKSPVTYKNDLKKKGPSYNLERHSQFAAVISNHETTTKWSREKSNRNLMFKNYFKIARRNLLRNKSYAAMNVAGLAVGIAVCMMIFIIIQFQTSFDDFHAKKDRIYRVLSEYHHADATDISYGKGIPFPMPPGLKTAFPQLEQVAPVYASHDDQLQILDANGSPVKNFKEQNGVFYTGPSFFKIFNFPLLAGSYASLKDPNNVLLTKEIAAKYFGDWKTAIGKTLKITGSYRIGAGLFQSPPVALKVSGILANIPANTDFQLKLVIAFGTDFTGDKKYGLQIPNWNATAPEFGCYVLLPPNISADYFNQQLSAYSRKALPPDNKDSHIIQSLSAVHYDTQTGNYSNKTISRELINVLWLIAAFILLIACVNFINLSTAQAVNRAKEVGVRKVLGSSKPQLQIQFIVETFLIVACAVVLATVISILALSSINQLLELSLSFNIFKNPAIVLFLLIVTILVTALAGFYPSLILSGFNPIHALKSKLTINTTKGISLRRALVVFQFIIAQALIIGTLVIVKQMNYFMSRPLGFDKEALVTVPFRPDSAVQRDYLRQQLLSVNGVQAASFSSSAPVENDNDLWTALKYDHAIKEADFQAIAKFADNEYVPTYKLQLVAGRNLQASNMTREFLVNESLVKSLGLKNPEDILGKEISMFDDLIKCPVVGVLKDFNDRSFHHTLAPLLITTNGTMYRQAGIKLATTNISSTMSAIKKTWEQTFPDYVYEYKFLDDKIESFYKQENQLAVLYKIFSAIAIFLSCLGLYGLASFMAVQRIKEVGIRKVLGASTGNIVYLFSKEFIILIAISFAIATPITWYYMHTWLQDYAYRISISWWLFVAGGLVAIIIALATISFQAIKAALANPVKSLRSE